MGETSTIGSSTSANAIHIPNPETPLASAGLVFGIEMRDEELGKPPQPGRSGVPPLVIAPFALPDRVAVFWGSPQPVSPRLLWGTSIRAREPMLRRR
jgi:hypothetical protein